MIRLLSLIVVSLLLLVTFALAMPESPVHLEVVLSDSMAPTLRSGDLLVVRSLKETVQAGMIITFEYGGQLITHRVLDVEGSRLVTKGDNNSTVDPWEVEVSDVKGLPLLRIPYFGSFLRFLRRPAGLFLLILVPAMAILLDEMRKVIKIVRERNETLPD